MMHSNTMRCELKLLGKTVVDSIAYGFMLGRGKQ